MSTRGTDFLHVWLSQNLSTIQGSDVIAIAEAIQRMIRAAKLRGIDPVELEEGTGSIYQTVLEAVLQGGLSAHQ